MARSHPQETEKLTARNSAASAGRHNGVGSEASSQPPRDALNCSFSPSESSQAFPFGVYLSRLEEHEVQEEAVWLQCSSWHARTILNSDYLSPLHACADHADGISVKEPWVRKAESDSNTQNCVWMEATMTPCPEGHGSMAWSASQSQKSTLLPVPGSTATIQ